jgi:CRISPR-associated protein Cas1
MRLFLDTFGASLVKKDGNLLVKTKDGSFVVDPNKVEAIVVSRGALVSSDAVIYAAEHSIDIVFTDKMGKVKGRVWSPKVSAVTLIRRHQLEFSFSSKAVEWIKKILAEKITNQIAVLLAFYDRSDEKFSRQIDSVINKLQTYRTKIESLKADFISEAAPGLRGWEGAASKAYFSVLGKMVLPQYQTDQRSQHPARDVFNALLNYAYGILYGRIESALIKAGIDPYVGVMHREDYGRPVLTFDVIEKFRHWADFVVVSLLRQNVISDESFSVDPDGGVWLEGLGKRILIQSMYDYLDEQITYKGKHITRTKIIDSYAFDLAKMFLRLKSKYLVQLKSAKKSDDKDKDDKDKSE